MKKIIKKMKKNIYSPVFSLKKSKIFPLKNIFNTILLFSMLTANTVTFSVDMSNETLVPNCSPTLAGNFNDWTYAYNLVNQGNNIWSISIDLQSNSAYEYKFGICSWELEVL